MGPAVQKRVAHRHIEIEVRPIDQATGREGDAGIGQRLPDTNVSLPRMLIEAVLRVDA